MYKCVLLRDKLKIGKNNLQETVAVDNDIDDGDDDEDEDDE